MTTAIGQTIVDVITLRDEVNDGILGLTDADFSTLEAFLVTTPATVVPVELDELDDGQYAVEFAPTTFGKWAFHYVYDDGVDVFREDTKLYDVVSTNDIVVVTTGGTWTYTGDLTDPIQEVRFLIQDTDGDHPLFVDTDVSYALGSVQGNVRRAASTLVERLMARYAGMADTTELDLSVRASQLFDHAKILLESLNNPFTGADSPIPYAGGISHADIQAGQANPDRVAAIFDRTNPNWRDQFGGIRR